jgi:tetratricopeptide (TPR) repeat protein
VHVLIVGGSRADRLRAASAWEHSGSFRPSSRIVLDPAGLPILRPTPAILPAPEPRLLRIDDLETAFSFDASSNLRVIVTQSTYILQKWIDVLGAGDRIVATADRELLERNAPEAFATRGPWRLFRIVEVSDTVITEDADGSPDRLPTEGMLSSVSSASSVVKLLGQASACRDRGDIAGARQAIDEAIALEPDWEAVHYEDGKFWLACDDMERARDGFQRAADLMPTFSAAFSNLGATLGELDQPEAAVAAFSQALQHDPESFTILNNIGVVNREIGRLDESERALLRVTEIAPGFVFGHYNLGHTRFLRGNYIGALKAYEEGQRRDPEKNRRQGCRLALVRFALDDIDGAERELWRFADQAPREEREDLLLEAYEIAQALVRAHPPLASSQRFIDRIAAELAV